MMNEDGNLYRTRNIINKLHVNNKDDLQIKNSFKKWWNFQIHSLCSGYEDRN